MKLELPGRLPLPDDVRARALDAVLAGIEEEPDRRRRWLPAVAAAAVAVALVVSVSVAAGALTRPEPALLPAAPPAPAGPPPVTAEDTALERCLAAATGVAGAPPAGPTAAWRVDETFVLGTDSVIVIDGAYPCLVTPDSVTMALDGTPMGDARVARLSATVIAVLNPQRRDVEVAQVEGVQTRGELDAPVRLVLLPGPDAPEVPVYIDGSWDRALPPPAPAAVVVQDRVLPAREPTGPDDADLTQCLLATPPWQHSRGRLWLPALRHDPGGGRPEVLVARIADRFAGFCTVAPGVTRFTWAVLDPGAPVQVAPSSEWDNALLAVPEGTRAVEVDGARCSVGGDLAFCTGVVPGATAQVTGPDGRTTEVPVR